MAAPLGSAGTTDTRVDRPDEGLPGIARVADPTASVPTRATFDIQKATPARKSLPTAVIDTSGTSGLDTASDVKRGQPAAWV